MATSDKGEAAHTVMAYHERSKHHLNRYAAGPEALDWDAQPNPFREFTGSPQHILPLLTDETAVTFAGLSAAPPPTLYPPGDRSASGAFPRAGGLEGIRP